MQNSSWDPTLDGDYASVEMRREREKENCHREAVYAAERGRLDGEPTVTPEELHGRIEALLYDYGV